MYIYNKNKSEKDSVTPLDEIKIIAPGITGNVSVYDGDGNEYYKSYINCEIDFIVGGALGVHKICIADDIGNITDTLSFNVDAKSEVNDTGGKYKRLFEILEYTMNIYGGTGSIIYNGKEYINFVSWILDHLHTAKGFKYLDPHADGLVNLLNELQKENGMIWSFVHDINDAGEYHYSAYNPYGYAEKFGDIVAARQPVENHCEYNYVDCVYLVWQSCGGDEWMQNMLESCKKALDYSITDKARWSEKYKLLKRGYTIDSWDFQPHDKYLVDFKLGKGQMIDSEKTKFTVFYGDNTGYAQSCDELAAMLSHAGYTEEAEKYTQRAADIRSRLDKLAWNGKFYRHRIEEDPEVVRDFGVDETKQISFSNCYTLNRGCTHEQAVAIIKSYLEIKDNLPKGSPGEFYAIYPPFEHGFDENGSNNKWQYMNGGVHPHAAGELARGAFKFGYEKYGADILSRIKDMAEKSNGLLKFAYTGAYEENELPAQVFTPVDISAYTNMDLWNNEKPKEEGVFNWMMDGLGNDLRYFPTGKQIFADVPYIVADPEINGRKAAMAISKNSGLPESIEIPVNATAGSLYFLHATAGCPESGLTCIVTYVYDDGTEYVKSVLYGKNITNWWFSQLNTNDNYNVGIAWKGKSEMCIGMGVCWAEIINPNPDKKIKSVRFNAGPDGALYALLGLTLSDRSSTKYKKPPFESTGGPDNWSGGLCMAALIEGLAGITDKKTLYNKAIVSPRWTAADVDFVFVTARYAASNGYVRYGFNHMPDKKRICMIATGSGRCCDFRVLLPENTAGVDNVTINGEIYKYNIEKIENSLYCVFSVNPSKPLHIHVEYL